MVGMPQMRGEMEVSSSFSKMTYKGVQYVPLSEAQAEIERLRALVNWFRDSSPDDYEKAKWTLEGEK